MVNLRRRTANRSGHDRLLDTIKSVAIIRVIAWHTWSWPWLSWVPAMPMMFFANGALLHSSLDRRGWIATLRERARRLLIPFWFYGVVCWIVMLTAGWRPSATDAVAWILPLTDPTGSAAMPGLWIPLWYIRAYIWFVILSGVLDRLQERLGTWVIVGSSILTVAMWAAAERGHELPFAVADAIGYMPFILAGMLYRRSGRLGRAPTMVGTGLLCGLGAVASWYRFGPPDAVVNRSYLLMLLVGFSGVLLAVGFKHRILGLVDASERTGRLITSINSRALTVYLWQGFGLVAADRLVAGHVDQLVLRATASIVVVAVVVIAATLLFGPLEDVAARRIGLGQLVAAVRSRFSGHRGVLLRMGAVVVAIGLVVASVVLPVADEDRLGGMPLSGRAVVSRAEMIGESIGKDGDVERPVVSATTTDQIVEDWLRENSEEVAELDLTYLDVVVIDTDGDTHEFRWGDVPADEPPMSWWSMTKSITAAWMMQLVDRGVVSITDRLDKWVPEAPHADEITLEDLARHLSGIPTDLDGDMFDTDPTTDTQRYFYDGRLVAPPGESFNYSRIGYLLLGLALERASGTTWTDAVSAMADAAGVEIGFDDDWYPLDRVTDPDRHGYRGELWAAGGIVSTPVDLVGLVHWIFTEGLSPSSIDEMTRFSGDPDRWFYGLGVMPICPCEKSGGELRSTRFGLDSATGSYAASRDGSVVMLRPSNWFRGSDPVESFFGLEAALLDHVELNGAI